MGEAIVHVNGVDLCTETFGAPGEPPILLVSGMAASMDWWDTDLCRRLALGGRHVIRYDLRDTGRSVTYPPGAPGYTGDDLIDDAVGLIDLLAGGRAHIVGISMGGAIAQHVAIDHPERVATLTLVSTSTGPDDDLPRMEERIEAAFADPAPEPDWSDPEAVVDHLVEGQRLFAGPDAFDEAYVRGIVRQAVARTIDMESTAKNHAVVKGSGATRHRLGEVTAPTLVIHGGADPFFPPGHAVMLAREINRAQLLMLDGVGHEPLPPSTWDIVVPALLGHTATPTG
ncbi:alpha/beta fold hydrolase [Phytohabitans kaempferiae]|uniref:Alpha/beta fold hydrolase n=1 Tax=Phytohabitans kaempferiae TaxID=1620943 RepID=A0ABV6M8E7_9ACTN